MPTRILDRVMRDAPSTALIARVRSQAGGSWPAMAWFAEHTGPQVRPRSGALFGPEGGTVAMGGGRPLIDGSALTNA
jgi:hypothetical protein